jgi:hypothetical protein
MNRRSGRRAEPRIVDPKTHPRQKVGLRVAALYLEIDERTLKARVDEGLIECEIDGRVYRFSLTVLVAYKHRVRHRLSA